MAITTTTKFKLPSTQLPTGASNDTLTTADYVGREDFEVTLTPASSYDNDVAASFLSAVATGVQTYVESTLAADLALDVDNVVGESVITSIVRGPSGFTAGDLNNQHKASTDQFVVKGHFVWYNNA